LAFKPIFTDYFKRQMALYVPLFRLR